MIDALLFLLHEQDPGKGCLARRALYRPPACGRLCAFSLPPLFTRVSQFLTSPRVARPVFPSAVKEQKGWPERGEVLKEPEPAQLLALSSARRNGSSCSAKEPVWKRIHGAEDARR